MNWTLRVGTLAAIGCLAHAGLAAQSTATATTGQKSGAVSAEKITVSGCIERADQMSSGTTTGTTVDSLSFVLIDAPVPDGAVGTAGAASDPKPAGKMYRLDADTSTLNPHVGHKVEITGTLTGAAMTSPAASSGSPADAGKLRVDTVKMVSDTCRR